MSEEPLAFDIAASTGSPASAELKQRICSAYQLAHASFEVDPSVLWGYLIKEKNRDLHAQLLSADGALGELDDPGKGYLFYGFDNLYLDYTQMMQTDLGVRSGLGNAFYQELVKLGIAIGVLRDWNPEGGALFPHKEQPPRPPVDEIIQMIEEHIGFALDFPNPFPDEFGLRTSRGIISQRSIHAVYQAWRVKMLTQGKDRRVVEIGAGLGRNAYYAVKFGVSRYTIVDIPMTNAAQALYLASVLPPETVGLYGEGNNDRPVRVMPPQWLDEKSESFDIMFNADSFTEMSLPAASKYVDLLGSRADILLSINHEANEHRLMEYPFLRDKLRSRSPYWLRPGYVEEVYQP